LYKKEGKRKKEYNKEGNCFENERQFFYNFVCRKYGSVVASSVPDLKVVGSRDNFPGVMFTGSLRSGRCPFKSRFLQ